MVMRDGELPVPFPCIFGHEGAGVVESVGEGVAGVAAGDTVLISFASCGTCPACGDHEPGYCNEFFPRNFLGQLAPGQGGVWSGEERVGSDIFGQSAFATYALAHEGNVVKIDPDLPLELLAPLGCGIQTGAGTVLEALNVQAGETLAVLGAGAVGLSAVMAARIAGAGRISVLDRHAGRLELARSLGAHDTATDIAELDGPFDYVVDTTGVLGVVSEAVGLLTIRGTLALAAAYPPGQTFPLEPAAVMSMGRKIIGVVEGGIDPQQFIPRLIEYYRAGDLPMEKLVKTFAFSEIEAAVEASKTGEVIKPVLIMETAQ